MEKPNVHFGNVNFGMLRITHFENLLATARFYTLVHCKKWMTVFMADNNLMKVFDSMCTNANDFFTLLLRTLSFKKVQCRLWIMWAHLTQ